MWFKPKSPEAVGAIRRDGGVARMSGSALILEIKTR